MLVEEIPKGSNAHSSTIYFSSSINLTARLIIPKGVDTGGEETPVGVNKKGRTKVNYNLNQLMNAQVQVNQDTSSRAGNGPLKTTQQVQLERLVAKRLTELNQESSTKGFELPKNFTYNSIHSSSSTHKKSHKSRLGNTPTTKRILSARRNLNLYFEEERNLISVNTILALNYQFVDFTDMEKKSKKARIDSRIYRPKLRLCCICGSKSNYSRCKLCGLYFCSVKCNNLHQQLRCA